MPRQQQDRSVVVSLKKALAKDVSEHLRDGTSPELVRLQKQLAAWSRRLGELPEPTLPEVLKHRAGRTGDNWRPLIAIAELAGDAWKELALAAVTEADTAETRPSRVQRLLTSIKNVFDNLSDDEKDRDKAGNLIERIETGKLLAKLISDETEEWGTANRGKAISWYWLRDNLRGLLDPPGSAQWQLSNTGPNAAKTDHRRGYYRYQFNSAWETYLPETPTHHPPQYGISGSSGIETEKTKAKSNGHDRTSSVSDEKDGSSSGTEISSSQEIDSAGNTSAAVPDEPDIPDVPHAPESIEKVRSNGDNRHANLVADEVIELAAKHPDWSASRIAKTVGIQVRRVNRYLGRNR